MSNATLDLPLTEEQRAALEARDRSVSLAAGAGCGKTFVLTERFLSYVDPRSVETLADLHELVAITFTDAAAREMRQRIRERCWKRLVAAQDSQEAAAWQRLLRALDSARISTIHSFCGTLLRTHSVEAGLDPQFEQLEPAVADLLRIQTVDDRLRELLIERDPNALNLATHFGLAPLRENLTRLIRDTPQSFYATWQAAAPADLIDAWNEYYNTELAPLLHQELVEHPAFQEVASLLDPNLAETDKLREHLFRLQEVMEEVREGVPSDALISSLVGLAKVQGVCRKNDWSDPEDHEQYKNACSALRELITKKTLLGRFSLGEEATAAAECGIALMHLAGDISAIHAAAKRERNQLEFDDLLASAHRLLTDPAQQAVRDQLADSTRLLMVDEFQDTDPLQVAIVKAFCGDAWQQEKLFVVGDFKQSIYGFRGAEPAVSNQLRSDLPPESRLSLTTNFRSQPAVVDFVNAVFHNAFAEAYQPLRAHRPQVSPQPAIEFLWSPIADDENGKKERSDAYRRREADWIARRLVQLLNSGERLVGDENAEGGARPLKFGDVAILLRALGDVHYYETALREHGLPYYLAGGHAFYTQQEIYDVLNLLRAVESVADELSLAGALRSPLFSLTDETLYWLVERHGSLNAGLFVRQPPAELSEQEAAKVRRAAATLGQLRQHKGELLVAELLLEAIALTGFDAALQCEFLGQRKWANVEKLIEQARTLDRDSPGNLAGFITQLAEFVVRAPKEALAATQAEGDVIRIMTIHNAKGLEFPLVVLPDLERKSPGSDHHPQFDARLGPLVPNRSGAAPVGFDLYQQAHKLREQAERTRVFYVAATRAADYLLLSSSVRDLEKPTSDSLKLLSQQFDLVSGEFTGELPPGYNRPQVRVAAEEPALDNAKLTKSGAADLAKMLEQTRAAYRKLPAEPAEATAAPLVVATESQLRFSFSRLSGTFSKERRPAENAQQVAKPPLQATSGAAARGLGTLIHAILERIDFKNPGDVRSLCEFLAPSHLAPDDEAGATDAVEMTTGFLASPRAAALAAAQIIRPEVEFLLPWPGENGEHPGRYLHGYIDCLYRDSAGDWRLLDYKSNQVKSNQIAEDVSHLAEHYEMQMFVYSQACEQALGAPLAEAALHFLRPGVEHSFHWDDAGIRRNTAAINLAMAQFA